MNKGQVFIGTSGFMYPHWRGHFYPRKIPQREWLEYYCQHFNTVELNVSFYRLPKKETFEKWRRTAGSNFVFSAKGSRYITHIKRLKDCWEPVERFFKAADGLNIESKTRSQGRKNHKSKFMIHNSPNVVLWQLPPRLKLSGEQAIERLSSFLDILSKDFKHAFEFRDESWVDERLFEVLKKHNSAMVFQDFPDWPITEEVTADFVYLRLHGRTQLYASGYSNKELKDWSRKIDKWMSRGLNVYAYFNNDALGYAVENALALKALLKSV